MLTLLLALFAQGCGGAISNTVVLRALSLSECGRREGDQTKATNLVLLNWTGGISPIYPDTHFQGLNLDDFETAEGGTLADDAESFQELVRLKITQIYCEWPEVNVLVQNGEDDAYPADTIVYLTQHIPPNGSTDIGEGEYDPCNNQQDNAAVIFGKRLRQLSDIYTFDEWVRVFANVCAHEIGHTLGYGHIARDEQPDIARALYVELMLGHHTMAEMTREQRFVIDQTNCPDDQSLQSRRAAATIVP